VPAERSGDAEGSSRVTTGLCTRWLFAFALVRLHQALALKELGTSQPLLTVGDVGLNGERFAAAVAAAVHSPDARWEPPGEKLRDTDTQRVLAHNAVVGLWVEAVRQMEEAGRPLRVAPGAPPPTAAQRAAALRAGSLVAGGALRVLVHHLGLTVAAPSAPGAAFTVSPARAAFTCARLPSIPHLLAPQKAPNAFPPPNDKTPYSVNPEAAVVLIRAALFLALQSEATAGRGGAAAAGEPLGEFAVAAIAEFTRAPLSAAFDGAFAPACDNDAAAARLEASAVALGRRLLERNALDPIVLLTPELKSYFTSGGLGTMVEELAEGLADLGQQVVVIAPYYNKHVEKRRNAAGEELPPVVHHGSNHWAALKGFRHKLNVHVRVGDCGSYQLGVHEAVKNNVRLLFLHNEALFPELYATQHAHAKLTSMVGFSKAALEALCQFNITPSVVVSNDWFTALTPAYARRSDFFGAAFNGTDFLHIVHNLDPTYEGRLTPELREGNLANVRWRTPCSSTRTGACTRGAATSSTPPVACS